MVRTWVFAYSILALLWKKYVYIKKINKVGITQKHLPIFHIQCKPSSFSRFIDNLLSFIKRVYGEDKSMEKKELGHINCGASQNNNQFL